MDSYIDLKILPDPELTIPILMGAVFSKLHRALVEINSQSIGVSFPNSNYEIDGDKEITLGKVLRIHSEESTLQSFMEMNWIGSLRDYVQSGELSCVPSKVKHRVVQRVQAKSNGERLRRRLIQRLMQRETVSMEEAEQRVPHISAYHLKLPYLKLRSQSTGQTFPLLIKHGPLQDQPIAGVFNSYGLSDSATIPWFPLR